ncbi:SDR family oxidoreductase [uncultured Limnohabitans sp.]|mgnify:FL=1|jgi:NAD(P)-dependent dehydrogenase (short-subunit alcohol dehydrogenase family)|uniref:SDR family oxidoreductase n=1 Tax=uncultured Limnohabitans sp. TaxID=768543 RepID=UPI002614EAFA|nr:SDR family oxidoreductase [uncultured Limnohabitans sp.]
MNVIIITGASEGIGAEMATQLARTKGAAVALVLAARQLVKLEAVAEACRQLGAQVLCVRTDVSVRADCEALIAQTVQQFGRIDTLINNAGISAHAMLQDVDAADLGWYEELMRVNLWGTIWCTHAALPHLKASRGRLVAVSSLAGLVGVPGRTAYCTSKFAMTGFMEALRTELLSDGVSVTIAYPGVVDTDIRRRGLNAMGQPAGSSGLSEDKAMPVELCVQKILQGTERRQRDVLMSPTGHVGRWLKLIAPSWVDRMAWAALKKSDTQR